MEIDCEIEDMWPGDAVWSVLAEDCSFAAASVAPKLASHRLYLSVLFTDDAGIQALNRKWRAKDKPTNVLSFPMMDADDLKMITADGPPEMLGDIALSFDTCAREALEKGITLQSHAAHLLIHGLLHLAGYDHERGEKDAEEMERLEINALAVMGIVNPYGSSD